MMVKVGDKVRALVTEFDVREGNIYEVDSIGEDGGVRIVDDVGDAFFMYDDQVEPVAVADSNGNQHGNLRIREGGYYKTRDGRKVGPMTPWTHSIGWQWESEGYLWKDDGENYDKDSVHTIVAEWTDEPAAAATTKFKVGDRVQRSERNAIGTIKSLHNQFFYEYAVIDYGPDWGEWKFSTNELRLVAEATSGNDEPSDIFDNLEDWMVKNDYAYGFSTAKAPTDTAGFTVPLDAPEFAEKEARFLPDGYALRNAVEMVRTGCCTINEVRNVIGLPPITSGHLLATL